MHWDTNGARLVSNRTCNCLANPPCRIRREFVTTSILELINCLHQTNVAFLDEIKELKSAVGVLLSNRNNQTKVCFDHFFLGATSSGFTHTHPAINFFDFSRRQTHFVFDNGNALLKTDNVFAVVGEALVNVCFLGGAVNPVELTLRALEALDKLFAIHSALSNDETHNLSL